MIMPGNTTAPRNACPSEAIDASHRGYARRAAAEERVVVIAGGGGLGCAGEGSQHVALGVEELDLHFRRVLVQEVVEGDVAIAAAHRVERLEHEQRVVGQLRRGLAQHADVVEHVEAAAVRADHEVALFRDDAVDRRDRQVELQRLPRRAVVERHVDAVLGADIEQPRRLMSSRITRGKSVSGMPVTIFCHVLPKSAVL